MAIKTLSLNTDPPRRSVPEFLEIFRAADLDRILSLILNIIAREKKCPIFRDLYNIKAGNNIVYITRG